MKKSDFFSRILPVLMLFMTIAINAFGAKPAKQQYYEIKIYRISDKGQEGRVDAYLKEAYLPALHRAGIPVVGVFKPVEADTAFGKLVYVFIPYKTIGQFMQLADKLELNYKTVRHHLKMLTENNIITSTGKNKYGELYFLSNKMEENYHTFQNIWKELK